MTSVPKLKKSLPGFHNMNFIQLWFLLITESFAREHNYSWKSSASEMPRGGYRGLAPGVLLLLKQGLKIGYLPPTEYNCKFFHC